MLVCEVQTNSGPVNKKVSQHKLPLSSSSRSSNSPISLSTSVRETSTPTCLSHPMTATVARSVSAPRTRAPPPRPTASRLMSRRPKASTARAPSCLQAPNGKHRPPAPISILSTPPLASTARTTCALSICSQLNVLLVEAARSRGAPLCPCPPAPTSETRRPCLQPARRRSTWAHLCATAWSSPRNDAWSPASV